MNNKKVISFIDFPETFLLDEEGYTRLLSSYIFDVFNIRTVLCYSEYIGIEKNNQRMFSIIFMRHIPYYILGGGCITLNRDSNRLTVYLNEENTISVAQIK